nr:class I SAM-dependent methyltransferase [Bacteriovorax sp. HI3]
MTENAQVNQDVWKKIYRDGKGDLKYPSDLLVRVANMLFPKDKQAKILDFGFGTGANALHFAKMGHDVHGLEVSPDALKKTSEKFSESGFKPQLELYEVGSSFPFLDNSFDIIVAWQVLYYNNWSSLEPIAKEIERVLRPGGLFVGAIAAPGDISQVHAEFLGDSTYRSLVPGQEGCIVIIPEKKELARFFPNQEMNIGFFEYEFNHIHAKHWIFNFSKK